MTAGSLWRWDMACWAAAGSLFGGLMFSGDLDTVSRPLKRWGWLQWLWWPYRQVVPHRHSHSHGLLWGPFFRLAYLGVLGVLWAAGLQWGLYRLGWVAPAGMVRQATGQAVATVAGVQPLGLALFGVGLLFGNAVHSLADWTVSGAKRVWRR